MKIIDNILHRIKEDSLSKKTDTAERVLEYKELAAIKTCLVFWVADYEQSVWLKKLADKLKGVKMDKLCFIPKGVEAIISDDIISIRNEDLSFGGKIQNDRLPAVITKEYDLLIDLSTLSNGLIVHCLTNSLAHCKVGMKKEGFEADIIIDEVSDPLVFIDELFAFLSKIKNY